MGELERMTRDDRVAIPLDAEEVLRALLRVDPNAPPDDEAHRKLSRSDALDTRSDPAADG